MAIVSHTQECNCQLRLKHVWWYILVPCRFGFWLVSFQLAAWVLFAMGGSRLSILNIDGWMCIAFGVCRVIAYACNTCRATPTHAAHTQGMLWICIHSKHSQGSSMKFKARKSCDIYFPRFAQACPRMWIASMAYLELLRCTLCMCDIPWYITLELHSNIWQPDCSR